RSGLTVTSQAQLRATGMAFMDNAPRHDLSWSLPPVLPSLSDGMGRVILILIEIAKDCLPRGGLVKVLVEEGAVAVSAEGEVAQLPGDLADVILGTFPMDAITPQTVHGALVQAFIQALGGSISIETSPGSVHLNARSGDQ
ncbi:MAG: histidine phosphotransferase family protein, partial [Alphaproteobacteria bacterium]|nr:histidine phosphotransferase family protein [Alphaproteobacteria bacterium]